MTQWEITETVGVGSNYLLKLNLKEGGGVL